MAGRFPFDQHNPGQRQPQLSAQMRAALGLTGGGSTMEDVMFLQQQQRQQEIQRDLQLRQMLLQEQLEQQAGGVGLGMGSMIQEHQLRSMGDHLGEYPDLQQHYHSLLLNEQMQRQEERALLEAQAARRFQDDLRLQQLQLAQQQEPMTPQARAQAHAQALSQASAQLDPQGLTSAHAEAQTQAVPSSVAMLRDLAFDSLAGNAVKKTGLDRKRSSTEDSSSDTYAASSEEQEVPPATKRQAKEPKTKKLKTKNSPKSKTKSRGPRSGASMGDPTAPHFQLAQEEKKRSRNSIAPQISPKASPFFSPQSVLTPGLLSGSFSSYKASPNFHGSPILNPVILDAAMRQHMPMETTPPRLGTLESLLAAARVEDKEESALHTLRSFKSTDYLDSEDEPDMPDKPTLAAFKKGECVKLSSGFVSELPRLPQEPLYLGPVPSGENGDLSEDLLSESSHPSAKKGTDQDTSIEVGRAKAKTRTVSNVLEYPYAIDVWWPSTSGIQRERKMAGEESDEDNFEEEPSLSNEMPPLRTNLPNIRRRLTQELKPGVLEKLPHCKLHRLLMRRKKNLPVPDLVFCWQVSDIYPNDTMVCCSMCGTWRHAACGGHHEPFSVRENTKTPFAAVCDFCHEEEKILCEYSNARKRLERQRMEQIRRGLATSAVMRHASFSKHGGTYKWPLGRVSATHLTGHTRSVHSRHDKAEKQWGDMVTRLGSGYGHRPRERARVRTKELERLLVSVEDAEAYTDRHNILLFLMRDTMRDHPIGFEKERRNIFDPEEDPPLLQPLIPAKPAAKSSDAGDAKDTKPTASGAQPAVAAAENAAHGEATKPEITPPVCACKGCLHKPRFDSLFCSDSCGVAALELDLLHSFQESSDIHPSILRN